MHQSALPLKQIINFPESINNQIGHLLPLGWFIFGAGDSRAVMNTKSSRHTIKCCGDKGFYIVHKKAIKFIIELYMA